MKSKTLIITAILIVGLCGVASSQDDEHQWRKHQDQPAGEWTVPTCSRITGGESVTYTTDEGATFALTSPMRGMIYTYGLVTLDAANTLLASTLTSEGTGILRSEDAGCSWREVTVLPVGELLLFRAAPGGLAYAFSRARTTFYRIEGDNVFTLTAPNAIYGLAVNPSDAMHIRIGSRDCQLYESRDGGASFIPINRPANTGNNIFYDVAFSPDDWDQALCGSIGAWRTADAGQTWDAIEPFDKVDIDIVYEFVYSESNPRRVWARANLETMGAGYRDILVSDDGGATFQTAIRQGDTAPDQNGVGRNVVLTNQPTMAAHPSEDALYFEWGTYVYDYGTDLFKYNPTQDELTVTHTDALDGINAIAFNPVDPTVMYLGLEESGSGKLQAETAGAAETRVQMNAAPNPFNPSTEIRFTLPAASHVKLEVYNISGQKISTLVDNNLSAGEHAVMWDGSACASGVYLYRIEAGDTAMTKKMLLIK